MSLLSKKQAAFTLIELLIAISVMAISLAIGSVNYLRFLSKQNLYKSGANIESIIKDARLKAQNGFLGNEAMGFCNQVAAVEVFSGTTADGKVSITARLRCDNGSLLTYENYIVDQDETAFDKSLKVSFLPLPLQGATVLLNNVSVASGSATLSHGEDMVIFNLDQGGMIDVKYE